MENGAVESDLMIKGAYPPGARPANGATKTFLASGRKKPLRTKIIAYLKRVLPDVASIQLQHVQAHGRLANLRTPKTFSEKVQHRKLYERDPRFETYADKLIAKDIVRERLGEAFIIPTLWSGKTLPPREARDWPRPYVIKLNHGCGWNIFVRTAADEDWDQIERTVAQWLATPYKPYLRERFYHAIEGQILVEPLMGDPQALPTDYKFFCFNGEPEYVMVQSDRHQSMQIATLDARWNYLPLIYNYPRPTIKPTKPQCFEEMLKTACALAKGFEFVRIDLYEIDGRVLFGEFSFTPGSGFERFDPPRFNAEFGKHWRRRPPVEAPPI